MSDALNVGGAPASLEQQFEAPAEESDFSWLLGLGSFQSAEGGGAHQVEPIAVGSAAVVGQPGVGGTIAATSIESTTSVGTVAVRGTISAVGIASSSQVGNPEERAQFNAFGVPSAESVGTVSVNGTIAAEAVPSAEAVGAPEVRARIAASGVESVVAVGQPTLETTEPHVITVTAVDSVAELGSPALHGAIAAAGITSEASVGSGEVIGEMALNSWGTSWGNSWDSAWGSEEELLRITWARLELPAAGEVEPEVEVVVGPLAGPSLPKRRIVRPVLIMPEGIESTSRVGVPTIDIYSGKRRLLEQRNSEALMLLAA